MGSIDNQMYEEIHKLVAHYNEFQREICYQRRGGWQEVYQKGSMMARKCPKIRR